MKILSTMALMVMCASLFAANGVKTVDGLTFENQNGVWVQKGLGAEKAAEATSALHGDVKWQQWNKQSATLSRILELGENVIFQFPSNDGSVRVYSVFESKQRQLSTISTSGTTTNLLGSALLAGGVVSRGTAGQGSPSEP